MRALDMPAMDVLAALRVAANVARREGFPRTAARHDEQARALDDALRAGSVVIMLEGGAR